MRQLSVRMKDKLLLESAPYIIMTQPEKQQNLPRCFDLSAPHCNVNQS